MLPSAVKPHKAEHMDLSAVKVIKITQSLHRGEQQFFGPGTGTSSYTAHRYSEVSSARRTVLITV